MAIHGTVSESDYLAAQRLHMKSKYVVRGVAIVLLAAALVAALTGESWWLIGALCYFVGIFFVYLPIKHRRTYRQYKALSEPVTVEIREDGLFFKRAHGEALVPWGHIAKWRSNGKLLLLYPAGTLFYLVPARFFPNQESFAELVKLVEVKVGKAT